MKSRKWFLPAMSLLPLIVLVFFGGCVLPFTGTVHVVNKLSSGTITALYVYPQGSPDTTNDLKTRCRVTTGTR